jgi:hypothetical protein
MEKQAITNIKFKTNVPFLMAYHAKAPLKKLARLRRVIVKPATKSHRIKEKLSSSSIINRMLSRPNIKL